MIFETRPAVRTYAEPFSFMDFDPFRSDFFRSSGVSGTSAIRTDIRKEGDLLYLEAELPGYDKSDISVEIEEDMLTISANRTESKEEVKEDGRYLRRERRTGCFRRSFQLTGIDPDHIEAKYENGILILTLPKKEALPSTVRHLEIQ